MSKTQHIDSHVYVDYHVCVVYFTLSTFSMDSPAALSASAHYIAPSNDSRGQSS